MIVSTMRSLKSEEPLGLDFLKLWVGEGVSNLGTAFSQFGLPLLVFQLTGSALNLAFSTAATFLPYLFFGLIIGVWADRLNRKKLLILANSGRAIVTGLLGLLAFAGLVNLSWIYALTFFNSTLAIINGTAGAAVIPLLVKKDRLVRANGRLIITNALAGIVGPVLAGLVISVAPVAVVFGVDAFSFLVAAVSLILVKSSFDLDSNNSQSKNHSVRHSIKEGFIFLLGQPVILSATLLSTLVNFIVITAIAQQIFYVKQKFGSQDQLISWFFLAAGVGAALLSYLTGRLPKNWPPGRLSLIAMVIQGFLLIGLGATDWYWLALVLRGLIAGCSAVWNIQITSLIQTAIPEYLLGRVSSVIMVLAWAVIPAGSLVGGWLIQWTGSVSLVYELIGGAIAFVTLLFFASPLNSNQGKQASQAQKPI